MHFSQVYKGKQKSSEPITVDRRNKGQGKAEVADKRSGHIPQEFLTTGDQRCPLNLPSAHTGISRIKRSPEGKGAEPEGHLPATVAQSLGKVLFLGQNPVNNPTICLPRTQADSWRDGAWARGAQASSNARPGPREAWEAESWGSGAARLP